MTICYANSRAYSDQGLEWGRMWYLDLVGPDMQSENFHHAASVQLVIVARRRAGGNRRDGYFHHLFVRDPSKMYGEFEYEHVLDDADLRVPQPRIVENTFGGERTIVGMFGMIPRLFLHEVDAWQAYAAWLQWYIDRHAEKVRMAEQMMAEAEGMIRLKSHQHPEL